MLRDRSPTETLLTYATFFALSLAIHIVAILGGRPPEGSPGDAPQEQANVEGREAGAGSRR